MWNQGSYDAVRIGEDSTLQIVQVTCAKAKKPLKVSYIILLVLALLDKVKKIEIWYVVAPRNVEKFRAPNTTRLAQRLKEKEWGVAVTGSVVWEMVHVVGKDEKAPVIKIARKKRPLKRELGLLFS